MAAPLRKGMMPVKFGKTGKPVVVQKPKAGQKVYEDGSVVSKAANRPMPPAKKAIPKPKVSGGGRPK